MHGTTTTTELSESNVYISDIITRSTTFDTGDSESWVSIKWSQSRVYNSDIITRPTTFNTGASKSWVSSKCSQRYLEMYLVDGRQLTTIHEPEGDIQSLLLNAHNNNEPFKLI